MATPVLMPTFGMTEGEATILRWLKAPGQPVTANEALFEAESEKATLEVPSPVAGVLLRIDAEEGQVVAYRAVVGWIGLDGEPIDIIDQGRMTDVGPVQPSEPVVSPPTLSEWVRASPIARRMATEHNLDLSVLRGTGPQGRVVEADVRRTLAAREAKEVTTLPPAPVSDGSRPLTTARRLTAARMAASFSTAPHFYLQKEVRAARLVEMRAELLPAFERLGLRLSFTDLFIRAVGLVLPMHPLLNASWIGDGVRTYSSVDLGVAVTTPQGLVVPVMRRVETLSLTEIARGRSDQARRGRDGSLRPDEMQDGTFTLTNLGPFGIDSFIPILNPPQSAILATGAIAPRPVAAGGKLALEPTLKLTLAADHRVTDGVEAAVFLAEFAACLEAPSRLLL